MHKYTVLRGFSRSAWVLALLAAGCASQSQQRETYPIDVPPQTSSAPAASDDMSKMGAQDSSAVQMRADAPMQYVVKRGDTLWDIAGRFLDDPWQWPEIWYVNEQVKNPHLIYPGDQLTLIWVDGRPRVVRESDVTKLSPQVRASRLEDAIPTIPIDAIRDFLRSPRVVTREQLRNAPYVLDFLDHHIMGGTSDKLYLQKVPTGGRTEYAAIRVGERYVDPDSGRTLGWEALPVGLVEITHFGKPAIGTVTESHGREVRRGDQLIEPEYDTYDANFIPRAPAQDIQGRILSVYDGVSYIGQYQVVSLNRGAIDGIEPGHVLAVQQANRVAIDPVTSRRIHLPEAYAGIVMVFKVDTRVSYALVMSAVRDIHELDVVRKPRPSDR